MLEKQFNESLWDRKKYYINGVGDGGVFTILGFHSFVPVVFPFQPLKEVPHASKCFVMTKSALQSWKEKDLTQYLDPHRYRQWCLHICHYIPTSTDPFDQKFTIAILKDINGLICSLCSPWFQAKSALWPYDVASRHERWAGVYWYQIECMRSQYLTKIFNTIIMIFVYLFEKKFVSCSNCMTMNDGGQCATPVSGRHMELTHLINWHTKRNKAKYFQD